MLIYCLYLRFVIFLISQQHNKIAWGVNKPLIYAIYGRSLKCVKLLIEVCHFRVALTLWFTALIKRFTILNLCWKCRIRDYGIH